MLRNLGPGDLAQLRELLADDPLVNLFVDYRVTATRMQPTWLGGAIWGYFEAGELISACHAAANLVPVQATPAALAAFGEHALQTGLKCSSIVGLQSSVLPLWGILGPYWGPARSPRTNQPFMVLETDSELEPDPRVRNVRIDEIETLYPASVAMFKEEIGLDPEAGSRTGYRGRVTQLVAQGWSFAIIENDRILFKAEIGAATANGCQIQGVYVDPAHRGQGIAARAMAAVVQQARARIAPTVSLYVNHHNIAARRTYARVGFEQRETFATILL